MTNELYNSKFTEKRGILNVHATAAVTSHDKTIFFYKVKKRQVSEVKSLCDIIIFFLFAKVCLRSMIIIFFVLHQNM